MTTEPQSVIYGKMPPYVRSCKVSPKCNNGRNEKDVVIEYVVLQEQKSAFIASLPFSLEDNSLTPVFSAADIAAHGILSTAYSGLELQGVQESGEGRVKTLTITYTTPQAAPGTIRWWSSTEAGYIYHERARILLTESQSYAQAALTPKFGLVPNGANINPESDNIHATYEATWGPEDEEDLDDLDNGGSAENAGTMDTLAMATSNETIQVTDECIALSCGVFRGDMVSHGITYLINTAAMVESDKIVYIKDDFNGLDGWYFNSPDTINKTPFSGCYDLTIEEITGFAKRLNSKPTVQVPKLTVTIRRHVRSTSLPDIASASTRLGEESESISIGGVSFRAPQYKAPKPYNMCPIKTVWVYGGKSMDPSTIKKRYLSGHVKIRDTYITETWTTKTMFEEVIRGIPAESQT